MIENLERYRPLLLRIYQERCGDSASYHDVEDKFVASLEAPPLYSFSSTDISTKSSLISTFANLSPLIASPFVSYYFQEFLGTGGQNCSGRSFLAWANDMVSNAITPAAGAYAPAAWRAMIDQAVVEIKELKNLLIAAPANEGLIAVRARRAAILLERLKLILEFRKMNLDPYDQAEELIAAEAKTVVVLFELYIDQIMFNHASYLLAVRKPKLSKERALWFFLVNLKFFNDPLKWISEVYFRNLNRKRIGVEVTTKALKFDVEPDDVGSVKEIIRIIVSIAAKYGDADDPVRLNFSIDDEKRALVIESEDLQEIVADAAWNSLIDVFIKLGVLENIRFETENGRPKKIFIPFSYKKVTPPPFTPEEPLGSGPIQEPSAGTLPALFPIEDADALPVTEFEDEEEWEFDLDGVEEYFSLPEADFMPFYEYPYEYGAVLAP